jgi:Tol biopolymer transport system component
MIAPDGAALRDLGVRSYTADWHPDGTTLVLNTANESRLLTWNIETEGAEPQLLVDVAPARCRYPRWAPDGGSIAYFRWGPGPYPPHGAIRLIGAHGANDRLLIDGGQRSSWSPDGKRLVYEHFDPEQNTVDLWVFSVETGNATPLFTGDPDRPLTAKEESP